MKLKFIPLKWKLFIVQGFINLHYFGMRVAWARERCILSGDALHDVIHKDQVIVDWLDKRYHGLIEKYQREIYSGGEALVKCPPEPIWVFWWQGEETMPPIVQMCHQSKIKNANGHEVILLTKDNLKRYVEFPDYVWEQFEAGKLLIQHLADMVRVQLIWRYGGIWLDGSVFCCREIPETEFKRPIFSIKEESNQKFISECKWTTFAIGGTKGHILFAFLNEFFIEYCKTGKPFIDYFMFDCGIALAYRYIAQVREDIDALPLADRDIYWLNNHLESQMSESVHEQFQELSHTFSKIGWFACTQKEAEVNSLLSYLYDLYEIKDKK